MSAIVINAVPAYADAPIAADLLKKDAARFIEELAKREAGERYLLLGEKSGVLAEEIRKRAEAAKLPLTVVAADTKSRFVYANAEAAWRAAKGLLPLPSDARAPGAALLTVEDVVSPEAKTLYVNRTGAKPKRVQAARRTTLKALLEAYGPVDNVKAVYLGFPMGAIYPAQSFDALLELTSDCAFILTEQDCVLHHLASIAESFWGECCGQCVFGYEGLYQLKTILSDMTNKKCKPSDLDLLIELCETMRTQCLCEVGKAGAGLVLSAMSAFKDEIAEHITKKSCKAMFCPKFVTYHILQDKCAGCTECKDACDDDAIAGKKKFVHVIDQDECTQCGKCAEACEYGAIVKAGAVKPKCPIKPVPCRN